MQLGMLDFSVEPPDAGTLEYVVDLPTIEKGD
jgi:hypothetical protein